MNNIYYLYIFGESGKIIKIGTTVRMEEKLKKIKTEIKKGKLLFFETFANPLLAMAARKKIEKLKDDEKFALIKKKNPKFEDLFKYWKE